MGSERPFERLTEIPKTNTVRVVSLKEVLRSSPQTAARCAPDLLLHSDGAIEFGLVLGRLLLSEHRVGRGELRLEHVDLLLGG